MPPGEGRGEGGEHGITEQSHPSATVRRDEDHSRPPPLVISPIASEEKKQKLEQEQQPAASLPEGALVEILSRVPYRSLCRFKCVSKPWLALCSAWDILKRSPQTLSGFFYYKDGGLNFRNLNGRGPPLVDPSLPFLRQSYKKVDVQQSCDGLLLCRCLNWCSTSDPKTNYVVCNPATQEWTVLPPLVFLGQNQEISHHLGFEAAVPSRFVVFATTGNGEMAIYSSETGRWTYVETKWASESLVNQCVRSTIFFNGTMHLTTVCKSTLTVDAEGEVWREIQMPDEFSSRFFLTGKSQGCLYAWSLGYLHDGQLCIWVLEDYGTGKWTLKHTVNVLELMGRDCLGDENSYEMFAVHPDCNVIFLTGMSNTVSYDLDNQKVHVICTKGMYGMPYTPCFAELPSAGH